MVLPPALALNEILRSQGLEELEQQVLEEAKCVLPDHFSAAKHQCAGAFLSGLLLSLWPLLSATVTDPTTGPQ